ncbi:VOC family protein [Paenibacillus rhizovicinus]|uniref:VOC family protein n=1 Tax=Paenibacillus rhizovicinus TaxID=2704463 RepID=A0A6C0NZU4_9BACL|nr:VOC family protein [Paenibacillus rhizovicinus]QHW31719.1 VOC family protein [Paenibacillus rhizovicinus]
MHIRNRINTCFIHLKDMERGKAWYKSVFPFEVEAEGEDFLSFRMEGTGLMLLRSHHETIMPLPHSVFFFETSDVEQVFEELTAKGVETDGIQPFPDGMRGCHVFDPEGNMLLICTPPNEA